MKSQIMLLVLAGALAGCEGGGSAGASNDNYVDIAGGMDVIVSPNYGVSTICGYTNAPCVQVTICDAQGLNCSTVKNVLLDTGSYGLRLFQSTLTQATLNNLTPESYLSGNVAECVTYGDGSQNWGGVYRANVQLASNAVAAAIPIQIINANYGPSHSACPNAADSPSEFGMNGVLGVGVKTRDENGSYYVCNSSTCSLTSIPDQLKLANPVAFLPANNNGLTLVFPALSANGAGNVHGQIYFGVNSESENTVTGAIAYPVTSYSTGIPTFDSVESVNTYWSFLDTGTNSFSFSETLTNSYNLSVCPFLGAPWLCPAANTPVTIWNNSTALLIPTTVYIGNAEYLLFNGNSAYNNTATELSGLIGSGFLDFGMPFFYGKSVQIVFDGESAAQLGAGALWAW